MSARTLLAIRHVAFEDLGSFAGPFSRAGYRIVYHDVGDGGLDAIVPTEPDLVVVLGGSVGAYDARTYPFLTEEVRLLERRLAADRPTLGICLGAQLIAVALGARVYPASRKEIGWEAVDLTELGRMGPLGALDGVPVLHWHGDTFDLPAESDLLASNRVCPHQAFSRGANVLALQFHVEATRTGFENWLVGHAHELASAGIDPCRLREETAAAAPRLERAAEDMVTRWLAGLPGDGTRAPVRSS